MNQRLSFSEIRKQFPALRQKVNGYDLVYLDTAATSLKPQVVIDRIQKFNSFETANVHRGAHSLSDKATTLYEEARQKVADFIGARSKDEIVFTRGTTESLNLLSFSIGEAFLKDGDLVLLTEMEHHANIVPWMMLAKRKNLRIDFVKIDSRGKIDLESLDQKMKLNPKVFSFTACSNTLGTINDVTTLIHSAKMVGAITICDVAQYVSQDQLDVQKWDVDFLAFSGHKMFAPFGIGVVYGKKEWLDKLPPYQGGGSMIHQVSFTDVSFQDSPFRFEAGTPNVEGAVALGVAIDFLRGLTSAGWEELKKHESILLEKATHELLSLGDYQVYAELGPKAAILSFNLKGVHHSDVSQILDQQGIAVRAGHHCTQPLMSILGVPGTVRASFSIYNTTEDVERLIAALKKAKELFL